MDLESVKTYLRIDGNEEDIDIQELIEVSGIYIDAMVGEYYKIEPKAIKLASLLQRELIDDMYRNKGTEISTSTKRDKIVVSILDKLSNYYEGDILV